MDIYSTTALAGVVRRLRVAQPVILNMFFPNMVVSDEEEIAFDVEIDKRRVSPFVSPLIAGKVVKSKGFRTDKFQPAYIKDKRIFDPTKPIRRAIGEQVGGDPNMSAAQREAANVALETQDQLEMLTMQEELMAIDAFLDGKTIVDGEGFDAVEVNFGRDAALTKELLGAARWGEDGVSPYDDVLDWRRTVRNKSGAPVTDIVFGETALDHFLADPKTEKVINTDYAGNTSVIDLAANVGEGAELQGKLGVTGPNLWSYSQTYTDDDDNEQDAFNPNAVVMGNRKLTEGTRYYGAIRDPKAGLQAMRYFSKSWDEEDPAVRWLMLQAAPLMVPTRINSTLGAMTRQTIENLPREQGDPRVKSGVLIRGPGPDKFEAEDGDPELELSGGSGSAPAKSTPSTPSPETDDGLPKSLKPKGEAREGNVEIREGIEIAKVDIIARAFADFDGTVKAWNAQSDEQISERLYTAGEALLAERHPELVLEAIFGSDLSFDAAYAAPGESEFDIVEGTVSVLLGNDTGEDAGDLGGFQGRGVMSFALDLAVRGDLETFVRETNIAILRAQREATVTATHSVRDELRKDLRRGGLGQLEKTWRADLYPRRGLAADPAGFIYSRAEYIVQAFERGITIRGKNGNDIAIPIPGSPADQLRNPRGPETKVDAARRKYGELKFIPGVPGSRPAMLAAVGAFTATGRFNARKRLKSGRYGKGATTMPLFWLVDNARLSKRLNIQRTMTRGLSRFHRRFEHALDQNCGASPIGAVRTAAAQEGSALPGTIWRNEPLARAFDEGTGIFINAVDDDIDPLDEELGDETAEEGEVEFEIPIRFEIIIRNSDPAAREAACDAVLAEIRDALVADRTLGGACDHLRIGRPGLLNLSLSGLPGMKP
ncbi:Major capsid protein (Gene product 8) (Major head protein), partial [Durusdinium trenchii]